MGSSSSDDASTSAPTTTPSPTAPTPAPTAPTTSTTDDDDVDGSGSVSDDDDSDEDDDDDDDDDDVNNAGVNSKDLDQGMNGLLGEKSETGEEDEYDLSVSFTPSTYFNVWGIFALMLLLNAMCCFVCYKKKKKV